MEYGSEITGQKFNSDHLLKNKTEILFYFMQLRHFVNLNFIVLDEEKENRLLA